MHIAMKMGQKSVALLLRSFIYAKLRGATLSGVAPSDHHDVTTERRRKKAVIVNLIILYFIM
jgi:hypothetical protein